MKVFTIFFFTICILFSLQLEVKAQNNNCNSEQSLDNNSTISVAEKFIRSVQNGKFKIGYDVVTPDRNPDNVLVIACGQQIPKSLRIITITINVRFFRIGNKNEVRDEEYALTLFPGQKSARYFRKPKGFENVKYSGFEILYPLLTVGETSFEFTDKGLVSITDTSLLAAELEAEKAKVENYQLLNEKDYYKRIFGGISSRYDVIEEYNRSEEAKNPTRSIKMLSADCQINEYLTIKDLLESSDTIALATAVEYASSKGKISNGVEIKPIKFKVERVLKGNKLEKILLDGFFSKQDYKGSEVIQGIKIGREGEMVDCLVSEYKQNGKYLIFLKNIEGKLQLYSYPSAPVNEQIFENDSWLKYIENELSK